MCANEKIPTHLTHKPIVSVDYSQQDAYAGDAKYLSIGRSTWNPEDISAKIWRWADNGNKWSRQSEELPLCRVLDLATLLIATITGRESPLGEILIKPEDKEFLKSYIKDNIELYSPRIKTIAKLINAENKEKTTGKTPNIFSFATSELSQDAILSWLIKWADDSYLDEDKELCLLGKSLIAKLTGLNQSSIHSINVGRQWCNIDVWVEINEDSFLVIEDKTETSIHDDQLNRYRNTVEEKYNGKRSNLLFSYVKTGNEPLSTVRQIQNLGYKAINRQDLLSVLNAYRGHNPLVIDYRLHLQEIEDATNRYKQLPVDKWDWYAWQGFYTELEKHIDVDNWSYVSNPAGGFLGLWWYFKGNSEVRMYLQFEEKKLCFKIEYLGKEDRSVIRGEYHNRLIEVAKKHGMNVNKPVRFGAGTYMTIGVVPVEDVFGQDTVNIEELTGQLKRYEQIIDDCIACSQEE